MSSPCLQETESCADDYVCKSGRLRSPPPPRCFKAIHASNKEEASCQHHVCRKGSLCGSLYLHMGGAAPPRCFKAIHVCNNKEASCHHQFCSRGRLCGLRCSSPDIFRIYPKPNSHCKQGMDFFKDSSYRRCNGMVIPLQFPVSWKHQART